MSANFKRMGAQRKAYADWTDRIAAGAYPKAPPRPAGLERNLVISMWDWALPTSRRTDVAATDERTPTMNANGLVYGSIQSSDIIAVLDPRENAATMIKVPSGAPPIDTDTPASPFWGEREDLATVGRPAQRDDGQPRARVGHGTDSSSTTTARVLQRRIDQQVRQVLPDPRSERQADRGVRPEDEAVHDDRLLFCCGP